MIYKTPPEKFNPVFEIVSCFVEHNNEFLLLHRHNNKPEGNRWGVPAGKVDKGEEPVNAMQRELFEETGIKTDISNFNFFDKVYVRYPEYDFVYHMYNLTINLRPDIKLSPKEHKNFVWISPKKSMDIDMVRDLDKCVEIFYGG